MLERCLRIRAINFYVLMYIHSVLVPVFRFFHFFSCVVVGGVVVAFNERRC